jgi:drug/metabolite transporter (DMT)-like permease
VSEERDDAAAVEFAGDGWADDAPAAVVVPPTVAATPPLTRRDRLREGWLALPDNLRGSVWIGLGVIAFSLMTVLIKLVGARVPVVQILFVRQVVVIAFIAPMLWHGFPAVLRTRRLGLHLFRAGCGLGAMLAGFTAIVHMPLADATTISFAKTLFVTVLAVLILGEVVGPRRWAATAVGFLGVVVVVRPTGDGLDGYALLAVLSALCVAAVQISVRILGRSERSLTILAYQALVLSVVLAPAAVVFWTPPSPAEWALLVVIGLAATIGQWCNINAFRVGEAAAIAPIDYSRILLATVFGLWVFAEVPTIWTFVGAALIVGSTIYTVRRNTRTVEGKPLAEG